MKLYVMRHGPAEASHSGLADADRALTAEGRAETEAAARGLKRLGVAPSALLSSPVRRAEETAQIVARAVGLSEVLTTPDLASGASAFHIVSVLRAQDADTLIVGHNPEFSELVSLLLADSREVAVDFAPSGVFCIEFGDTPRRGVGVLRWYMRRKQLALLS